MCCACLSTSGLFALHCELGGCTAVWLIAPYSTCSRQNLKEDFTKCFLLGSDVLGTAAWIGNSAFVFYVFSTKYAVTRCLFWSGTLSIIPLPSWLSLWFRVWRHLLALTYHCCVRYFGSNQQGCVQGKLAPCELPGCWISHLPGDRWCLWDIVEQKETVTPGTLKTSLCQTNQELICFL